MPKIITNDEQLRRFIPNVFDVVDDESPLYDKLEPFIDSAEDWLEANLLGGEVMAELSKEPETGSKLFEATSRAIAADAFAKAVPSLDLVLTPNGFGIVSNNNLVPASKERVERLIDSLVTHWSRALQSIIEILRKDSLWLESERGVWWRTSVLLSMNLVGVAGGDTRNPNQWEELMALRQQAYPFEQEIANGWISLELLEKLTKEYANGTGSRTGVKVFAGIQRAVCMAIKEGRLAIHIIHILEDLVTFIRNNPELNDVWSGTETSKLFSPPIFENKKSAGGYFF